MKEFERLYQYQTLLSGRRAISRDEILAKLEISLATFKRDLAVLRDRVNMPVIFDKNLDGYKLERNDQQAELPGLWFSHDEILALLTIQNMISQLEPGLLGPKLKPLQERLNHLLDEQGLDTQTLTRRVRIVHAGKRRMSLTEFEAVAKASFGRKQLHITHFNRQNGKTTERVISPQQLVHYRDNWYVDAWCHLRQELRSFAVDAIQKTQEAPDEAIEIAPETLAQHMQSGYGIFAGKAKDWATLRFSADRARWVQHELWHPEQVGTLHKDGSYTLEIPYADERELIGDILKHGPDVAVLSPKSLAEQVKTQLKRALQAYGKA